MAGCDRELYVQKGVRLVARRIGVEGAHRHAPANSEDCDLTLAFQRGEKGAYQAIHNRYSKRVHAVCRRMLVNPEDAAEASQETFLRVYQGLGRFNGRYQLNAWITRVATNVCLDQLRARGRKGNDLAVFEVSELDTPCEPNDLPEEVVIRRSESRHVRKVLQSLPPLHRAAIVLRDFEGLSYQEVADALQISDAQVKALLHRARQRFKRDWIGSLAALLPWRLVQKVKGGEYVTRDGFIGSAAQVAPACSNVVQQCGQYMLDKLAPALTVAILTSTAVAPAVMPSSDQSNEPSFASARRSEDSVTNSQPEAPRSRVAMKEERSDRAMVASRSTDSDDAAPQPEAAPTPSPTPEPTPTPTTAPPPAGTGSSDGSGDGTEASPAPAPTPRGPFMPTIGFNWGRPIPARAPNANEAKVDCQNMSVTQRIETVVEDDDSAAVYPALLIVKAGRTTATIELTVWKNGVEIYYVGRGELVALDNPSADSLAIRYRGDYGTINQEVHSMDMPDEGAFDLDVGLDCARRQLITESLRLNV